MKYKQKPPTHGNRAWRIFNLQVSSTKFQIKAYTTKMSNDPTLNKCIKL